ncbi:MAG: hypothetical protein U0835_06470 [Isosphaeraceae bacterium]
MEQANLDRSKFNIIDPPAAYKVDVFVLPDDGFSRFAPWPPNAGGIGRGREFR